jgi:hypothetical protein
MEQNTEAKAAPAAPTSKKKGKRAKRNGKKVTKARKSAKKPKTGTVKDAAVAMLRKGTTVPRAHESVRLDQPHTARGFISNLGRLHGFKSNHQRRKAGCAFTRFASSELTRKLDGPGAQGYRLFRVSSLLNSRLMVASTSPNVSRMFPFENRIS